MSCSSVRLTCRGSRRSEARRMLSEGVVRHISLSVACVWVARGVCPVMAACLESLRASAIVVPGCLIARFRPRVEREIENWRVLLCVAEFVEVGLWGQRMSLHDIWSSS